MTSSRSPGRLGRWFDRILAGAVLVARVAILVQPGGVIRTRISQFLVNQRAQEIIREDWDEIIGIPSVGRPEDVLVEFMDYQCPFCREAEDTLSVLAEREGFHIVYRHFPLAGAHPRAAEAARAAICAEELGKFQEAHAFLMHTPWWEDAAPLTSRSLQLGVSDSSAFKDCLTSEAVEQRLRRDRELAASLGVQGTPTFVGRNGIHVGFNGKTDVAEVLTLLIDRR